ncbi:MAG: stage V sporulation protein AD [Clostridia bacterium]|nr:stage V sporulation protein AD [Clostridia bacterium]
MKDALFRPEKKIFLTHSASVVGKLEKEGPLGEHFDFAFDDILNSQKTWESAETEAVRLSFDLLMKKSGIGREEIGAIFAGDLMNQCTSESAGMAESGIAYFGLYGACSTYAEGAILAACAIEAGLCDNAIFSASSHFATAERQYRTPLEYGSQRTPTAQCTVTGVSSSLLSRTLPGKVRIKECLPGRIVRSGVKDPTNMGAAMAPAAADTLKRYFSLTSLSPADFDLIATGDLGSEGNALARELLEAEGYKTDARFTDCGMLIFDPKKQDVHCGGSGCGCSAAVTGAYLKKLIEQGVLKNVLLVGTGALMSPLSVMQKNDIPGVAHLVRLTREENEN